MCCRSEWQERMYIYKWHEVDQTKHEIFCVHIVCNEIQVKVNLEITTFFFYLRFPYCPNFFWFGVVYIYGYEVLFFFFLRHSGLIASVCSCFADRLLQSVPVCCTAERFAIVAPLFIEYLPYFHCLLFKVIIYNLIPTIFLVLSIKLIWSLAFKTASAAR